MEPEAADGPQGWFYLDAEQQSQGPFTVDYLHALNQQGYFTNPDTLFWTEGMGAEWKPLRDLPELAQQLQHPANGQAADADGSGDGAEAAPGAEAEAADGTARPAAAAAAAGATGRRGAAAASAPAVAADPQLAGFLSEISALEAEGGEEGEGDAPASPPPDERTFEDDDGTTYVWDPAMRKFQPLEPGSAAAAAAAAFTEEDMVFVPDDEELPEYQPPLKYADLPDIEEDEAAGGKPRPQQGGGGNAQQPATAKGGGQQQPAAAGVGPTTAAGGQAAPAGQAPDAEAAVAVAGEAAPAPGDKRSVQVAALEHAREKQKKAKEARQQAWFDLKINTNVYVTGLPEDVTEAELIETFSKCGVIKEDLEGKPKVKMYRDKATGRPKGDGLVTYLKEPSVDLALQILDGTPFRYGLAPMTVTLAKFEQKGESFVARAANKKVAKKKLEKLEKRALGWGGFDDTAKPQQVTVILRNMFHPDEFLESPFYKEELEGDLRAECGKLGKVDKMRVFQGHPQGVVSVKFVTADAADECVRIMNGRFFGGRQLEAAKWDGYTNFNIKVEETEEEQQARLERFAQELEAGSTGGAGGQPPQQQQPPVAEPGDQ